MAAFDTCLPVVLREEGGFVNDPRDRGGMTNLGVTARAWMQWTGGPVNEALMRGLTPAMVTPLFKARYWNAVNGDRLPAGIDLAVFDFAVNAGPGGAAKFLQGCVGAKPDGQIGPKTIAALQQWATAHGAASVLADYMDARRDYYRGLSDFPHFGKGWLARCDRIGAAAKDMLQHR